MFKKITQRAEDLKARKRAARRQAEFARLDGISTKEALEIIGQDNGIGLVDVDFDRQGEPVFASFA